MAYRYSALKDVLCVESALAQSAHALDLAAKLALDSADVTGMMKVAQGWAELSHSLHFDSKENRDNLGIKDNDQTKRIGFHNG